MSEESIIVKNIAAATGKRSGLEYWRAETNRGVMSIFDKEVKDELEKHVGVLCVVDTRESKDKKFKNINAFISAAEKPVGKNVEKVVFEPNWESIDIKLAKIVLLLDDIVTFLKEGGDIRES